jgi:hypothetical protein
MKSVGKRRNTNKHRQILDDEDHQMLINQFCQRLITTVQHHHLLSTLLQVENLHQVSGSMRQKATMAKAPHPIM